ncbi:hypothetical protein [Halomontanus rarus]|nr:hypothetical protein [Halovivax sp. TS33]
MIGVVGESARESQRELEAAEAAGTDRSHSTEPPTTPTGAHAHA